jgi:hypothetical protein
VPGACSFSGISTVNLRSLENLRASASGTARRPYRPARRAPSTCSPKICLRCRDDDRRPRRASTPPESARHQPPRMPAPFSSGSSTRARSALRQFNRSSPKCWPKRMRGPFSGPVPGPHRPAIRLARPAPLLPRENDCHEQMPGARRNHTTPASPPTENHAFIDGCYLVSCHPALPWMNLPIFDHPV